MSAEVVSVYRSSPILSNAAIVTTCCYPSNLDRRNKAMEAFAAYLEQRGARVAQVSRSGAEIRRGWRSMTPAASGAILQRCAYILASRRLACVQLAGLLIPLRRSKETVDDVLLRAHARGEKLFKRGPRTGSSANNVRTQVITETRPVVCLAHAIAIELMTDDAAPAMWPEMCLVDAAARLDSMIKTIAAVEWLWTTPLSVVLGTAARPVRRFVTPAALIRIHVEDDFPSNSL